VRTFMTVDSLCIFEAHRDRLFGVAYRMTGSVSDAQDIVQDAWLRWQAVDPERVDNPEAFLVRTTTRLAIDRATTARRRSPRYGHDVRMVRPGADSPHVPAAESRETATPFVSSCPGDRRKRVVENVEHLD
jgi:DNA-directed RNA polymerase specialized sigma24 family protein